MPGLPDKPWTTILFPIFCLFLPLLQPGCEEESNSDQQDVCADEFCHAWCLEFCADLDFAPWGGCQGYCADDTECMCAEYICLQENCNSWCQETQGEQGGDCYGLGCDCY